jgi:MFS family permease
MLSPFAVRSFRFQWPADLATSWAFEMEALILGWYILSTTGSVQQLVIVAALAWLGSLFSPFFGMLGDRIGHRELLCITRGAYAALAAVLAALTLAGTLAPWHVFTVAALNGLMRPSDMVMRNVIVGHTMRPDMLMKALGLSRTTSDTARVAGALAGAGGVALIGMGTAYVVVTAIYVAATLLSLGIAATRRVTAAPVHPMAELKEGFGYVWRTPEQLGAFAMAFLVNLLAYPFVLGLLPYVAKEVYGAGQIVLGYLAAAFWLGGLIGSLELGAVVRRHAALRPDRQPARRARLTLCSRHRAELLHDADRRDHAARRRRVDARPRDGRAHAGDLGAAARPGRLRSVDRARRLRRDGPPLLRRRAAGDPGDRLWLARSAVAAIGHGQRSLVFRHDPPRPIPDHKEVAGAAPGPPAALLAANP